MTELTNSSQGTVETGTEGLAARDTLKELNVLSIWILMLLYRMDADGVRKVTVLSVLQKSQLHREKTSGLSSAQGTGGVGTSQKTMAWLHNECGGISIISYVLISL